MPFYEYECQACKFYTEVMQKISDAPLSRCPSCGKKTLKKLVSAPVFRLKGSGWYETDFKSDKENKRNLVGAEKDDSGSKAESKPETKPAEADNKAAAKGDSGADTGKAKAASTTAAAPSSSGGSARHRGAAGRATSAGSRSAAARKSATGSRRPARRKSRR